MSQWPFSTNFRRFKPHSRSSVFRDDSPEPDSDDMFWESLSSRNLPNMSRFGSAFDSPSFRSNMRPSFLSHHFDNEPFFRNSSWMDDDMRPSRGDSPMDTRRSPTPQRASNSRGSSASPGTSNAPFFGRHDNGRVPTNLKRETSRSSTRSNSSNDSDNRSDYDSPGIEKHAGVKAKVNSTKNPQQAQRQPKVHHIPIRVEPRDEPNSHQNTSRASREGDVPFDKPINEEAGKRTSTEGRATVRIIPVQVTKNEKEVEKATEVEQNCPSTKSVSEELIDASMKDLEELKVGVEKFRGTRNDKEYLYLDEMLTRHLIRLDNIQVDGNNDLRQSRRAAIKRVNSCIHLLESKVISPHDDAELDVPADDKQEVGIDDTVDVKLDAKLDAKQEAHEEIAQEIKEVKKEELPQEKETSKESEEKEQAKVESESGENLPEEQEKTEDKVYTSTVEMQIDGGDVVEKNSEDVISKV